MKAGIIKKGIITLVCILCIYFAARFAIYLFTDEGRAESPYDETFVTVDNCKELNSMDVTGIQTEILNYISNEWKEITELLYINVYLHRDLQLGTVVFVYELDDVNNYSGRLEVWCNKKDGKWKIMRAESIYYYDEEKHQDGSKTRFKDDLLMQKIQAITEFIELKDKPEVDLYRGRISGNSIYINAYNETEENIENHWTEDCRIYWKEGKFILESKEVKCTEVEPIMVGNMFATYEYIDRELNLDYFYSLDSNTTYDELVNEIGKPNGAIGFGITTPYYQAGNQYIAISFAEDSNGNYTNIIRMGLYTNEAYVKDIPLK